MKTTTETFITIQLVVITTDLRPWTTQVTNLVKAEAPIHRLAKEELLRQIFREEQYGRPLLNAYLASEIDEPRVMSLEEIHEWDAEADDARWQTMRIANLEAERAAFEAHRAKAAAGSKG